MCGITGYYCLNKKHIPKAKKTFHNLLEASVDRGDDATGVAFIGQAYKRPTLFCLKQALASPDFIQLKEYNKIMRANSPEVIIGHTRAKTKGEASNNYNNHPIMTKTGLAIVHNGMINNDDFLFEDEKLERDGQVDSEIIVKLIEKYKINGFSTIEAIQSMVQDVSGSLAVALIDRQEPMALYLFAVTSPLVMAFQKSTHTIFFASTQEILESSVYTYMLYFNVFYDVKNATDFIFQNIGDKKGVKITPKGIERFELPYVWKSNYTYGTGETKKAWSRYDPIKRPGQYTTKQLNERLETLKMWTEKKYTMTKEETIEIRRIEATIRDRQKIEKRIRRNKQIVLMAESVN